MTHGTAGLGDGIVHGTTAAGMIGAGMAVTVIIHGPTGDVHGAATGVATGEVATGVDHIVGIMAGMATTIIVATMAVVLV